MKFGKQLRATVEASDPEWGPNFMSYKILKKRIGVRPCKSSIDDDSVQPRSGENGNANEAVSPALGTGNAPADSSTSAQRAVLAGHQPFFTQLKREVDKVNAFFLEKQEDFVIEHAVLSRRVAAAVAPDTRVSREYVNELRQSLLDLHAQLVLLEHYSAVNYTGFRKILKKLDKKSGTKYRAPYLRGVSLTPFFLSDTARKLLLDVEAHLEALARVAKFKRSESAPVPAPQVVDAPGTPTSACTPEPPTARSPSLNASYSPLTLAPSKVPNAAGMSPPKYDWTSSAACGMLYSVAVAAHCAVPTDVNSDANTADTSKVEADTEESLSRRKVEVTDNGDTKEDVFESRKAGEELKLQISEGGATSPSATVCGKRKTRPEEESSMP